MLRVTWLSLFGGSTGSTKRQLASIRGNGLQCTTLYLLQGGSKETCGLRILCGKLFQPGVWGLACWSFAKSELGLNSSRS